MSSARAGLPGWWSPLGAGSRASLMPGEAGIRAAGISGSQQAPAWSSPASPPHGVLGLLSLPDARHTRILLQNWIC